MSIRPGTTSLPRASSVAAAVGAERGLDGGDSAGRDADVADGVEPQRRIDDAPASDDEVVAAWLRPEPAAPASSAAPAAA